MASSKSMSVKASSPGDAAVGGLVHGLVAGLAMALFLVAIGLLQGQGAAVTVSAFAIDGQPLASDAVAGLLRHLATAGVFGLIWGVVWRPIGSRTSVPAWLGGLVYGLLLWVISLPVVHGLGSPLAQISSWAWLGAQVIYGLLLGFLSRRK